MVKINIDNWTTEELKQRFESAMQLHDETEKYMWQCYLDYAKKVEAFDKTNSTKMVFSKLSHIYKD